jgi:exonuclease VII large subunit
VQRQLEKNLNALSSSVQRTTSNATDAINSSMNQSLKQLIAVQQQSMKEQQNMIMSAFQQQQREIQQQLQKDSTRMIWTTRTPYLVLFIALLVLIAATWIAIPSGLMFTSSTTATAQNGQKWVYLLDQQWQGCKYGNQTVPCKPIR